MLRKNHGTVLPLIALLLVGILGFGTLAIDFSQGYVNRTIVNNAVDFATLAGTSQLQSSSNVTAAKNAALQYLNDNLTMSLPSFSALTLASPGLTIQGGVYDFTTMTFTFDEASPNLNALMISYNYIAMTYLAQIFMIDNLSFTEQATVVKRIATQAPPGTGFPLVIYSTALPMGSNMVTLYSASGMDNSYWTDYTLGNPSTTDINNIVDYFQYGMGTAPPGVNVNDIFTTNDGGMGGVFMNLNPDIIIGMTYILSVVTPTMDNQVTADGFVAATITSIMDNMGVQNIDITITPGYIDNTWGGLQIGPGMTNITDTSQQALLSNAYGLVE